MRLVKLVAVLMGLLLIIVSSAWTEESPKPNQPADQDQPAKLTFEAETTHQVLNHAIDLWHDAVLKGDEKQALHCSDEINDILIEDIQSNKLQLKMLVRQVELTYQKYSNEKMNLLHDDPIDREVSQYRDLLPPLTSLICVKEELVRTITRTEAFSNKYRLLGDYLNLLRKELGLPKFDMVEVPASKPPQASKITEDDQH